MTAMLRVLVLDGHCDAAVAVAQSLGRAGAIVTVAARDTRAFSCRSRYATRVLQQPVTLPDKLADWIVSVASLDDFSLIVPSTEVSLVAIRALPDDHPVRVRCAIPCDSAIDAALDKFAMGQIAQSLGMNIPETRLITEVSDEDPPWGYPTVLKPLRSKFQYEGAIITGEAKIAHDKRERMDYQRQWLSCTALVEQEYVNGTGVAVSVLCDQGVVRWHFAHERLHELPLAGGPSTYRRSIEYPADSLEACHRFAQALHWHGVAMIEYKYDRSCERLTFLEVNPRLWGSLALAIRAGVNFPVGLLGIACGAELSPQPVYRVGHYARNLPKDITWIGERFRAERSTGSISSSICSATKTLSEFRRVLTRRESWDHFCVDDARTGLNIVWHLITDRQNY